MCNSDRDERSGSIGGPTERYWNPAREAGRLGCAGQHGFDANDALYYLDSRVASCRRIMDIPSPIYSANPSQGSLGAGHFALLVWFRSGTKRRD
jgi:hypothetical protein